MNIGHVVSALGRRSPHCQGSPGICQRYGVSELSVYGLILESDVQRDIEVLFLVEFLNNDFGPWGCKLDQVENDLSGAFHRKVRVALRDGVRQSTPSPRREQILGFETSDLQVHSPDSREAGGQWPPPPPPPPLQDDALSARPVARLVRDKHRRRQPLHGLRRAGRRGHQKSRKLVQKMNCCCSENPPAASRPARARSTVPFAGCFFAAWWHRRGAALPTPRPLRLRGSKSLGNRAVPDA